MEYVTIGLLSGLCLLHVSLFVLAYILVKRSINRLRQGVANFVVAIDENTPSPLGQIIDQAVLLLVGRIEQRLEARLRGAQGAAIREGHKAELDAVLSGGPPWLSLAAGLLPKKWLRLLMQNPQFVPTFGGGSNNGDHKESMSTLQNRIAKGD